MECSIETRVSVLQNNVRDKEFTDWTFWSMTWHALTNQKYIPTSPDGTVTFFGTIDFIGDEIEKLKK